jgi:hypothetical protein
MINKYKFSPAFWLSGVLIAIAFTWMACGPSAPFSSSDPPPTFAIYYTLSGFGGLYYPGAVGTGVSLGQPRC